MQSRVFLFDNLGLDQGVANNISPDQEAFTFNEFENVQLRDGLDVDDVLGIDKIVAQGDQ